MLNKSGESNEIEKFHSSYISNDGTKLFSWNSAFVIIITGELAVSSEMGLGGTCCDIH